MTAPCTSSATSSNAASTALSSSAASAPATAETSKPSDPAPLSHAHGSDYSYMWIQPRKDCQRHVHNPWYGRLRNPQLEAEAEHVHPGGWGCYAEVSEPAATSCLQDQHARLCRLRDAFSAPRQMNGIASSARASAQVCPAAAILAGLSCGARHGWQQSLPTCQQERSCVDSVNGCGAARGCSRRRARHREATLIGRLRYSRLLPRLPAFPRR